MHPIPSFSAVRLILILALAGGGAACDSPTTPTGPVTDVVEEFRAGAVLFTATAQAVGPDSLRVTLVAMNETDFSAQAGILGGNCMLRPRIYSERGGDLVWSAFDLHEACQEPLRVFQLEGGAEESTSQDFETNLDGGPYFVTLTIDAVGGLVELAAGSVTFE